MDKRIAEPSARSLLLQCNGGLQSDSTDRRFCSSQFAFAIAKPEIESHVQIAACHRSSSKLLRRV
jgi:hypothetical protein